MIVAQPKAADPMIAPDAVLPVKVTREAAQTEVRQWIATRWFAPNALKKMAQQEGIAGVYLPFWTYAADTESQYMGARGVHYFETEYFTTTDSNGNPVQAVPASDANSVVSGFRTGCATLRRRAGAGDEVRE